jgi:hypothetical protein
VSEAAVGIAMGTGTDVAMQSAGARWANWFTIGLAAGAPVPVVCPPSSGSHRASGEGRLSEKPFPWFFPCFAMPQEGLSLP